MAFFDEIAKQAKQTITFTSIATGQSVEFPAFVTSFSDGYTISWGGSTPFGRVDPIKSYQSTSRRINATFDILCKDRQTAQDNFFKYSKLIQMMYPVYSDPIGPNNKSRTIRAAPLMRIKYVNYLRSDASPDGLLGCIQGVTFQPKFESGHFLDPGTGEMIPIVYNMSFVFEPLHETPLGSNEQGQFLNQKFPYNQGVPADSSRQPAGDPTE